MTVSCRSDWETESIRVLAMEVDQTDLTFTRRLGVCVVSPRVWSWYMRETQPLVERGETRRTHAAAVLSDNACRLLGVRPSASVFLAKLASQRPRKRF